MMRKFIYSFIVLVFTLIFSCSEFENDEFTELVKISLRDAGNQLLLSNHDSKSLIKPVVAIEELKYSLSFEKDLSFEPNNLVSIMQNSFQKTNLPRHYRVEVIQCRDDEVAYSYQMSAEEETTIIPCASRILPKDCYIIEVRFARKTSSILTNDVILLITGIGAFIVLVFILYKRRRRAVIPQMANKDYKKIGSFQFYAEQNKLTKEAIEISLSKKECELLEIFVANPNQIIKRDELTKRVWEDNGVFVGRSLDTYISKLRKKLKEDDSVAIENIHGVGYKLVILNQ